MELYILESFKGFGELTRHLQDTQNLRPGHGLDLGDTVAITKDNTDLRGGHALLREFDDVGLHLLGTGLAPRGRSAAVRKCGAGNTLAVHRKKDNYITGNLQSRI